MGNVNSNRISEISSGENARATPSRYSFIRTSTTLSSGSLRRLNKINNRDNQNEHKRFGNVTVKVSTSASTSSRSIRSLAEHTCAHKVTSKGAVLCGSTCKVLGGFRKAFACSGYSIVTPNEVSLSDLKAHQLLIMYLRSGWYAIPFPGQFSRHSGTCLVLGDRSVTTPPFNIKVGDCFRLGSVGLVVAAMKRAGEPEDSVDERTLEFLKDESIAFELHGNPMAALASDEVDEDLDDHFTTSFDFKSKEFDEGNRAGSSSSSSIDSPRDTSPFPGQDPQRPDSDHANESNGNVATTSITNDGMAGMEEGTGRSYRPAHCGSCSTACASSSSVADLAGMGKGVTQGEKFICYMCYETHNTEDDALVAPCDCKGDTRYLHVQCLQRWYSSTVSGVHVQVIRTAGNGAPVCKICGAAYRTSFRRVDGSKGSILETDVHSAYLTLVVVTRHDTNPGLFNSKFRLKFGHNRFSATAQSDEEANTIMIGRSSTCNMVLDYRTVSTTHASINYSSSDNKFYISDMGSSNGTLIYLQDPLPLPYNQPVALRMGRTTLDLQARRGWTATMRSYLDSSLGSYSSSLDSFSSRSVVDPSTLPTEGEAASILRSLSCKMNFPDFVNFAELDASESSTNLEFMTNISQSVQSISGTPNGGSVVDFMEGSMQDVDEEGDMHMDMDMDADRVEHYSDGARFRNFENPSFFQNMKGGNVSKGGKDTGASHARAGGGGREKETPVGETIPDCKAGTRDGVRSTPDNNSFNYKEGVGMAQSPVLRSDFHPEGGTNAKSFIPILPQPQSQSQPHTQYQPRSVLDNISISSSSEQEDVSTTESIHLIRPIDRPDYDSESAVMDMDMVDGTHKTNTLQSSTDTVTALHGNDATAVKFMHADLDLDLHQSRPIPGDSAGAHHHRSQAEGDLVCEDLNDNLED